ncbi:hypothetical protein Emag_007294 [Eimeria magna]
MWKEMDAIMETVLICQHTGGVLMLGERDRRPSYPKESLWFLMASKAASLCSSECPHQHAEAQIASNISFFCKKPAARSTTTREKERKRGLSRAEQLCVWRCCLPQPRAPYEALETHPAEAASMKAPPAGASEGEGEGGGGCYASLLPSVLLFDGAPFSGGPSLRRASLLAALPNSSYVALRTFGRGSRLLGVKENIQRLVVSAAAAAAAAAASSSTSRAPPKPQANTQPACATDACSTLEAEERSRFETRVWADLRLLSRVFQASVAACASHSNSCYTSRGEELLVPEGCEAAVTVALSNVGLPALSHALKLSEAPALAAAAAATPLSVGFAGGLLASLHLVLLAEPLIPSPFIFYEVPRQQQQQQQQQQEQQQQQQVPSGLSQVLMTTPGQRGLESSSNSSNSSSSSGSSSSAVRWCNVMLVAHGGRVDPEAKSTRWASERKSLLGGARELGCILGLPIEEAILEKEGCLLEGCSSNLLIYSASRGCVLTAPDSLCLPGLVRSLALKAFLSHGIEVVFEAPQWKDRQEEEWTAAWISSSSRLLLPVRLLLKPKHVKHSQQLQQQQLQQQQQQLQQQQQQQLQQQLQQGRGTTQIREGSALRMPQTAGDIVPSSWGPQGAAEAQQQLQQQEQQQEQQQQAQQQQEQQQQAAAAAASTLFEEFVFEVGYDSLAARAARWTAELAEAEAQSVI